MTEKSTNIRDVFNELADLVEEKDKSYGSAVDDDGKLLKLLFPNGIPVEKYDDAAFALRIFGKMKRIATNPDAYSEDSRVDGASYFGLWVRNARKRQQENK